MGILKRLENLFTAAAFAEAGEFDAARQIVKEDIIEHKDDDALLSEKAQQVSIPATET
jgi:hypothetical protein